MNVKWMGPLGDYSGYGEASRNFIAALNHNDVNVTSESVTYVYEKADFGWKGKLAQDLEGRPLDYKIKVISITPENYHTYIEKGKYNIAYLYWETDGAPPPWIKEINKLNELWTASPYHAEVFRKSGVKIPIFSFPSCLDVGVYSGIEPFEIPNKNGFMFYSIFQWTERKNPKGLLTAYWKAFQKGEDVTLLLKVYRSSFQKSEYEEIKKDILKWKEESGLKKFPRVILYGGLLDNSDILRLHASGDCFISMHRGEGWGLPHMDAMAMGNPIISTNYGGIHDYMDDSVAYLLPHKMVKVFGMSWIPWYTAEQKWAEADEGEAIKKMRYVFSHRKEAKEVGRKGQRFVFDKFDYRKVGIQLRERLEEIDKKL